MSITETTPIPSAAARKPTNRFVTISQRRALRLVGAGIALLVLLSITRVITGAVDLTSSGTMGTTLRTTIPILLAGLAGLWAERVGIVNIGIEGMMIFGTWFGAYGAWQFGPWVGLLMGIGGGAIGGLIHALATVRFNVDHVISGVALNLFAAGGMRYLSELVFVGKQGGGISQSPSQKGAIPRFDLPFAAGGRFFGWQSPDTLGWIERRHWFIVGDLAGVVRGFAFGTSWATLLALLLVPLSTWVLWRTRFGLRLRSSGEAPLAAETLGVKVTRVRYVGLIISGAFAGLGGAYLSVVSFSNYRQGQTAGRGFIGLATMIFGNWRPSGVLGGATLFGFSEALKLRRDDSIPALFLFVSFVAALILVYAIYRKRIIPGVMAGAFGLLFLVTYLKVDRVPASLTQATPYLATLLVLATASQRLRPPAHAGKPYRSGDNH